MLFTSISFLYYFLPVVLTIYFLCPKKYRNIVLLLSSLIFYFYGEPKYVFLMLLGIFIAYIGGLLIEKYNSKSLLIFVVVIHIILLGVFKYTDFLISIVNGILKTNLSPLNLALPIGISFWTFQVISYEIDVYRQNVKAQRNFFKLATYVSLFPQLIAGPIVRYETVCSELDNRKEKIKDIEEGIWRFVIGLVKKVLLANMLGELCTKFSLVESRSVMFYWLNAISYMMQLYLDFSAYSDMAIGLGRIFGFHFLENFNYPFISKSVTEFWRRWHISLGSWFRDYVYIPLGGNRVKTLRHIFNIFVVWFLTGLWHGASFNFIIWGLYFGIILIIEKYFLLKYMEKWPNFIKMIYVLFLVMISFIIFSTTNLQEAWHNIIGLFGANGEDFINSYTIYYLKNYLVVIILSLISCTPLVKSIINKLKQKTTFNKIINVLEPICIVLLLVIVTAYLIDNSYNPFLYFRF